MTQSHFRNIKIYVYIFTEIFSARKQDRDGDHAGDRAEHVPAEAGPAPRVQRRQTPHRFTPPAQHR